jgi:hypothetical protein
VASLAPEVREISDPADYRAGRVSAGSVGHSFSSLVLLGDIGIQFVGHSICALGAAVAVSLGELHMTPPSAARRDQVG